MTEPTIHGRKLIHSERIKLASVGTKAVQSFKTAIISYNCNDITLFGLIMRVNK